MIQSVLRYAALPLIVWGIWIGLRRYFRMTMFVLSTVIYFLITLAIAHSEIRYGLPMQAVLVVFQAGGLTDIAARAKKRWKKKIAETGGRG
jgi:small basic protein